MNRMPLVLLAVCCLAPVAARADCVSFTPRPADLYDLSHGQNYTWGVAPHWADDQQVDAAVLYIENIRNWNDTANQLYVHLLEQAPLGVTAGSDTTSGDEFAAQGILLVTWLDLPAAAQDLSYTFSPAEVEALETALDDDGQFALAFDPDCHLYNDGVRLDLCTSVIPEPSLLALLLVGMPAVVLRRRGR